MSEDFDLAMAFRLAKMEVSDRDYLLGKTAALLEAIRPYLLETPHLINAIERLQKDIDKLYNPED